jgi:hypothetical protein
MYRRKKSGYNKMQYNGEVKKCRVLSFDVGIINLAYCIIEFDYQKNDFHIEKWDIINLVNDRKSCCYTSKTGKSCEKLARFALKIDDENIKYYCKAHLSKGSFEIDDINVDESIKKNNDGKEICSYGNCKKIGCYTSKFCDGKFCEKHLEMTLRKNKYVCSYDKCKKYITKGIFKNDKSLVTGWCDEHCYEGNKIFLDKKRRKFSQKCSDIPLRKLLRSMYDKLDDIDGILDVDYILIENQPALKNPTMKSVASILFSYFCDRIDLQKKGNTKCEIDFCSPSNKIKVGGERATNAVDKAHKTDTYAITKGLGVKICKLFIQDNKDYLELFNKHKKKDDLADAFLQAVIMHFPLPQKYMDRINKMNVNTIKDVNDKNTKKYINTENKNSCLDLSSYY